MKNNILFILLILIVSACSDKTMQRTGRVIEKKYIPKKTESYTTTMSTGKTLIPIVRVRTVPEKHILKVHYIVEHEKEIEVSKDEYEKTLIGTSIIFKE